MKTCKKCNETKSRDEYYKQTAKPDGKHPWCKECCKAHQKKNMGRRLELESIQWHTDPEYRKRRRELQRNWTAKNIEYKRTKERENRLNNPEPYKKRSDAYRLKNIDKIKIVTKAGYEVRKAVESGKLIKSNVCEFCNEEGYTEGAHHDYDKPLDIKWLCRSCHSKWDYHEPKIMQS